MILRIAFLSGIVLGWSGILLAQPATAPSQPTVTIDFPDDGIELKTLADIVTKRLGIPIIYDDTILNKRVIIRVPRDVSEDTLLGVLHSALRMKGMVLVDAEQPGWKQIIATAAAAPAVRPESEVRVVPLKEADATVLANAARELLRPAEGELVIWPDERLNQLFIIAPKARADDIAKLIAGMDKPSELGTKVYRLKALTPERLDKLIKGLLGQATTRVYRSTVDRESQSLVVVAAPFIHNRIDQLVAELDVPTSAERSPIRFYKLKNTKAADVLATIDELMGTTRSIDEELTLGGPATRPSRDGIRLPPARVMLPTQSQPPGYENAYGQIEVPPDPQAPGGVRGPDATVTADPNTNSIIVIAPPAIQQTYSELIERLDIRRPQVQVECTIVTLDTSDNFTLGVDIGGQGSHGETQIISFSSFGVSVVNPLTGGLTPTQGRGGTLAVLSPGDIDIVLRALAQNSRSRLVSAPLLLINDNGRGQLKSVNEEPYAEILDTDASQSRTSLGGFAQAGTTIDVEPHISDDDYLQLGYAIELSSFTGVARSGLPPPSQRNQVESTVTIPDGSTIIVGGLSVKNLRQAEDSIPFLNQIPLARYLFGTRTNSTIETTLFVFIRPTILRDDRFADLKYLSDRKTDAAGIEGTYPRSRPIPLR